jgi:Glycosyl Hydrolase Family 88/Bacterial Ig domain
MSYVGFRKSWQGYSLAPRVLSTRLSRAIVVNAVQLMNMIATRTRRFAVAGRAARFFTPLAVALLACGVARADTPAPGNDLAVTSSNLAVTISVLTNDIDPGNQLGILQVTAPAHGTAVINSNTAVLTPQLEGLFQFSAVQLSNTVKQINNTNLYPRSTLTNGTWMTSSVSDWIVGFFPGAMWYIYEQTGDTNYLNWARQWTAGIASQDHITNDDDVGFQVNTSFGNGLRITGDTNYRSVVITAAQSVTNGYSIPAMSVGEYLPPTNLEVILDTMMNLELLYHATDLNGNTNIASKAINHEIRVLTNQIRSDNSTFEMVYYDTQNGVLTFQGTRAGYANSSTWSRGQAWATYGLTVGYRETGYLPFLDAAQRLAGFFITNVPPDYVPYWDYDAPQPAPRDSSAASITMSALIQLSQLTTNLTNAALYWTEANNILQSLASTNYLAEGTTNSSILLHGTGNTPVIADPEVDVGLIYGDYYFVEGLRRFALVYGRNTITYTPNPGFTGTDSFTYQVCDSAGQTATATVTVVVQPGGPAPSFNIAASYDPATRDPVISFPTTSGYLYSVQYRDATGTPGLWSTLATNLVGSGATMYATDSVPSTARLYRVLEH